MFEGVSACYRSSFARWSTANTGVEVTEETYRATQETCLSSAEYDANEGYQTWRREARSLPSQLGSETMGSA